MTSTMPAVVPYLYYPDAGHALEFLKSAFGFEEHAVTKDADGVVWNAQLKTGPGPDARLVMIGPGLAQFGSGAVSSSQLATSRVHVLVDDVLSHCERARAAGAVIHTEPTSDFGDMTLYVASDCGSQQWIFAQSATAS